MERAATVVTVDHTTLIPVKPLPMKSGINLACIFLGLGSSRMLPPISRFAPLSDAS